MGNPPYDRQNIDPNDTGVTRKGGWVRFGEKGGKPIFDDFTDPLTSLGLGVHAKNLYNDYVYFWRWALWKVIDRGERGIVSFITAASYLRGPGFAAMREYMREAFDEIWIIDLEGDNLGARKTENVFNIQTPVAIAICVRYDKNKRNSLAKITYTRLEGTREEKLAHLDSIKTFTDLKWGNCLASKTDAFLPVYKTNFWQFPLLTDIFPWQENGMQYKRTWVISENELVLKNRWREFLSSPNRAELFKETRDRKISGIYLSVDGSGTKNPSLKSLPQDTPIPKISKISYRSFDRHWAFIDSRLGDYLRPNMYQAHTNHQLYLTSLLTNVLGEGPSAIVTNLLPDLDHFRGSFGAKHIIPLWQGGDVSIPNITQGVLDLIQKIFGNPVTPEDFFAYTYAVLFSPSYVQKFWEELTIPGIRLPVTKDPVLFETTVKIGKQLIYLHTYGERFNPTGTRVGIIPQGTASCKVGVPTTKDDYPETFIYNETTEELLVGKGVFTHIRPQVWNFSISGFHVVKSWLGYRMKDRAGKKSSPLDDIRPETWTFDNELLDLLWVLDHTIDLLPQVNQNLENILKSELIPAEEFPKPTKEEKHSKNTLTLFDFAGVDVEDNEDKSV